MARILILYSTVDGHTRAICARLRDGLERHGHQVTVLDLAEHRDVDLSPFDKVVIGASIRYGKHRPVVAEFIDAHQAQLDARPTAFFTVNVVARKPDKATPQTNPYLRKFLGQIRWRPTQLAVFAGRVDYPKYGFVDRTMIRLIMWVTHGPTDPRVSVEFTDWRQVDAFADTVSAM